jgi:thiamine-phosphate pyrophosphorylase
MGPVICMITDRRLLGGSSAALLQRIGAAARAGVHLIQIRERDLDAGALTPLVRSAVDAVRGTAARVVVNDRLDVGLAAGAHGVHLRAESMPAARVRAVSPAGFLVGRSVHAIGEARHECDRGGLDYLIVGSVFPTSSKPGVRPVGPLRLAAFAAGVARPVLAVGGVTIDRLSVVSGTGAAGFAAITLFADTDDRAMGALMLRLVDQWTRGRERG